MASGRRAPYEFEVAEELRAGKNHIKVRLANTGGNFRAVGIWRSQLENIDIDDWNRPARLVPVIEREIACSKI